MHTPILAGTHTLSLSLTHPQGHTHTSTHKHKHTHTQKHTHECQWTFVAQKSTPFRRRLSKKKQKKISRTYFFLFFWFSNDNISFQWTAFFVATDEVFWVKKKKLEVCDNFSKASFPSRKVSRRQSGPRRWQPQDWWTFLSQLALVDPLELLLALSTSFIQ